MGAASSQPTQPDSEELFRINAASPILTATPIAFSSAVLRGIEEGSESDRTRQLNTEYKKEARRSAELENVRDSVTSDLASSLDHLTTQVPPASSAEADEAAEAEKGGFWSHLRSPFYQDYSTSTTDPQDSRPKSGYSYHGVMEEVQKLKQRLDGRKAVQKPSAEVEKAREGLVQCLRINDRRPLDCWQEKEAFERAVRGMEKSFIEKAGR